MYVTEENRHAFFVYFFNKYFSVSVLSSDESTAMFDFQVLTNCSTYIAFAGSQHLITFYYFPIPIKKTPVKGLRVLGCQKYDFK